MKYFLISLAFILNLADTSAQKFRCSFSGQVVVPTEDEADSDLEQKLDDAVDSIVVEIVDEIGLDLMKFWAWPASNVRNFQAEYDSEEREYSIHYSFTFLKNIYSKLGSDEKLISAIYVIVAHEIGHHLNGHVHGSGGDPEHELAADYFAGKTAARHGIPLLDILTVYQLCTSVGSTDTHPGRADRIEYLKDGYINGL